MRYWWWKVLGAALLLYVLIIGLRTPLAPTLIATSTDRIAPGEVTLDIWGYNTHFLQSAGQVWIANDGQRLCATSNAAMADDHIVARFTVPSGLRQEMSDLAVFSAQDGLLVRPSAFYTVGRGDGIAEGHCGVGKSLRLTYEFPDRNILNESIRNLFFHVPMWFSMIVVMSISVWMSMKVLRTGDLAADRAALAAVQVGLVFCSLGLITGSLWARVTWETWWTTDVKLNGAAVGALMYLAYLVLRGSVNDAGKRARLAAIYNIFAFAFFLLFIMVVPRLNAVDSLHPGNGGNPAFSNYDLDSSLRFVFYPACIGWIILGIWMYQLRRRLFDLEDKLAHDHDH